MSINTEAIRSRVSILHIFQVQGIVMSILNRILITVTCIVLAAASAHAATFTVTNTSDAGVGSLRQAILNANDNLGLDTIAFNIPDSGPHTIQPLSALPSITDPVVVDGYTQPGASANTNPPELGSNAVLMIELNGSIAGGGHGLIIAAGGSTVRGLVINRFVTGFGIVISSQFGGNFVEGNFIGTDITGTTALGNYRAVTIFSPNNTIGGRMPGARNVLSGNIYGVWLQDDRAKANLIEGNYIGTTADGVNPLGNTVDGVIITRGGTIGASDNVVGGSTNGAGNVIAFNGRVGVFIQLGSVRNAILSNSIYSNGASQPAGTGLGIDLLSPFGVTANDVGDGDTGGNNLQNFPVLTSASSGRVRIEGVLNSTANNTFRLEFFSNNACDPSGNGEGERFLGSTDVTTDGSGNVSFGVSFPAVVPVGQFVTATATDSNSNTSEFSQCVETVVSDVIVVDVDIKPGSDPNCFNINSRGVIPVALLGGDTFDVTLVDQYSLLFSGLEVRVRGNKGPLCNVGYSDSDPYLDLVCHFEDDANNWNEGYDEATVTGFLLDGTKFEGTDSICLVP
jgi:hypothetical protein